MAITNRITSIEFPPAQFSSFHSLSSGHIALIILGLVIAGLGFTLRPQPAPLKQAPLAHYWVFCPIVTTDSGLS
jgi:hypothetical protein